MLPRDVRKAISGLRREAKRRVEQARLDGVDADPLDLGLAEGRFDGYLDASAAEQPLEVLTSLDTGLQLRAEELVRSVTEEHDAAGAMALVVEVASGEVLAIADHSGYALSGFMPAQYLFTPGSIMKPLVMAVAFDAGVVTPEERFRSNGMDGIRVAGRPRRVKEAKGAKPGLHTAAYGLAHSQNAVLVQIGMRIPRTGSTTACVPSGSAPRAISASAPSAMGSCSPWSVGTEPSGERPSRGSRRRASSVTPSRSTRSRWPRRC